MSAHSPAPPIASAGEAEQAISNLNTILDRLMETIEEETTRVRAGRLREAADLGETKTELSRRYSIESERVMAALDMIAGALPDEIAALRERNAAFRAALQTNLTVLATAHAVSEGIIRGVSGELARKRAPSTYGATGRANAPSTKASQPLAISRTL
jgi:hypothetical protein